MTRKTMKKMMATTLTMVMIGSTALGSTAEYWCYLLYSSDRVLYAYG